MKEYIVLSVVGNALIYDYRSISDEEKVFVNKNDYYKDSLYYGLKYFKRHLDSIIKNISNKGINTIKILRLVTFKYPVEIIRKLKIESVVLAFSSTIDLNDYNLFLESKSINNIYCYYIPKGVRTSFELNGVVVYCTTDIEISDEFLMQQDAIDNDTLYYKNIVQIKKEYPLLIQDLKEFLKLNYNLKAIHVYVYSKEIISSIVDLVKNDESRNVVVYLHQGYDKGDFILNNFDWLKSLSKKCRENYTCEFRIIYANQFLSGTLFKQLTFNNLKLISVLCIYVCVVSLVIVKSYEYIEEISVQQLRSELMSAARYAVSEPLEEDNEIDDFDPAEGLSEEERREMEAVEEEVSKSKVNRFQFIDTPLAKLKKINKEVKGYLVVKNTDIAYPVLQHSDNNYYLKHDIYKTKRFMGCLYFDYRNSVPDFGFNTIIYGHSMKNGTMFGTLKKTLSSTWRKDKDNLIIDLTTDDGALKFEIFSIYKVDYTTDYLKVKFNSDEEKLDFIKMIRDRSSFKSDIEVGVKDNILTLSTCFGKRRLVVHAKLIKDTVDEIEEEDDNTSASDYNEE